MWLLIAIIIVSFFATWWGIDQDFDIVQIPFLILFIVALSALIAMPILRSGDRAFISKMTQTKITIAEQRARGIPLENAALTQTIIDLNGYLSNAKYNRTIFFIRDFEPWEIDTTNFIK